MLLHAVVFFSRVADGVYMDSNTAQIRQVVLELVPDFYRNRMSFGNREVRTNRQVDFGM